MAPFWVDVDIVDQNGSNIYTPESIRHALSKLNEKCIHKWQCMVE